MLSHLFGFVYVYAAVNVTSIFLLFSLATFVVAKVTVCNTHAWGWGYGRRLLTRRPPLGQRVHIWPDIEDVDSAQLFGGDIFD